MNKKYIIVFGTLVLLLIIITGGIFYYQERLAIDLEQDIKPEIAIFPQNYPTNLEEFLNFIDFCDATKVVNVNEAENRGIKEIYCTIGGERLRSMALINGEILLINTKDESFPLLELVNSPFLSLLSFKESLDSFSYIGISVDLKDAIREYDPSLLEEEKLYFCSISEPFWADPFSFELDNVFSNYGLFGFKEGSVRCQMFENEEYPMAIFTGFVPEAESLGIKEYLVNEQAINNIIYAETFLEMKEILNDYPVIWQMEKPINL
jgi:hypothetical protein